MIEAMVTVGDGIGRTLGYPTANLDTSPEAESLENGVYAAYVQVPGHSEPYKAALVVNSARSRVEVYLLDFSEDLYGKILQVEQKEQVSNIEKFSTVDALIKKMDTDIKYIKAIFAI